MCKGGGERQCIGTNTGGGSNGKCEKKLGRKGVVIMSLTMGGVRNKKWGGVQKWKKKTSPRVHKRGTEGADAGGRRGLKGQEKSSGPRG